MKIAVIGLGYVGLPLSLQFARSCVSVLGLDADPKKVELLNDGQSYIKHIESADIAELLTAGKFYASTDFGQIKEVEAVIICVPTPLTKNREPDISYVIETGRSIAPYLKSGEADLRIEDGRSKIGGRRSKIEDGRLKIGETAPISELQTPNSEPISELPTANSQLLKKLIVLESTTYPGTTEEDLRAVLEEGSGMKAGSDFHLAFSPEREDPGNPGSSFEVVPKVVGGYTPACLEKAMAIYSRAVTKLVPVSSCRVAEATKLLENIFRSVNIAMVNELKLVYAAMGIDVWEVINAAKTKPFGFMPFYPGPGLGGHCIPIDPFYLTWKAREFEKHTRFIELAGEINTAMPEYVVNRVGEALNSQRKPLKGSKVLILGLAYKPDVDDDRESASYRLLDKLRERGADVAYYDPYVPVIGPTREHPHWAGTKSVTWDRDTIAGFDAVVIATAHKAVSYDELAEWAQCIVDTRNTMANVARAGGKVWKA
jgi:UDP-N-acetyl-D-glucosamine dehydrogenase